MLYHLKFVAVAYGPAENNHSSFAATSQGYSENREREKTILIITADVADKPQDRVNIIRMPQNPNPLILPVLLKIVFLCSNIPYRFLTT